MMKCRNCGKRLPFGVGVCDNCGAAVDWKKYIWMTAVIAVAVVLLIAALIGVLSREPEDKPEESTGAPTVTTGQKTPSSQPSTPQTTAKPTETNKPTETTTPPTTQPVETTQPTEPPTEPMTDEKYNSLPTNLSAVVHSQDKHPYYERYGLDASECIEGWLYIFNKETGQPTLICDEEVITFDANHEHIYYVTKQNPQAVIRSTLDGQEKIAIYAGGTVTYLDYFGGMDGSLGLVNDYSDMIIYDLLEGTQEVIFTYHDVASVYFAPWEAGYIEFETSTEGYYFCNLETGEIWQDPF